MATINYRTLETRYQTLDGQFKTDTHLSLESAILRYRRALQLRRSDRAQSGTFEYRFGNETEWRRYAH